MARTIRRKNAHDKFWFTDSWFDDRPDNAMLDEWERKRRYYKQALTVGEAKVRRRAWYHGDGSKLRLSAPSKFCRQFNRRLRHTHRQQVREAIVNDRCDALILRPYLGSEASWYYF